MRLFFTTDIHGSEMCWRKFINAGSFYEADVLVLGGDVIGKAVLLVEEDEHGVWRARRGGRDYVAADETTKQTLVRDARNAGFYPYVATADSAVAFRESETLRDRVFEDLVRQSIAEWLRYADERVNGDGVRVVVTAGNDDPMFIDEAFSQSTAVEYAEGEVVELADGHAMINLGWTNPTPWHTHRECSEEELAARIADQADKLDEPAKAIFNLHVPPHHSGLDEAPALDNDLRLVDGGGRKAAVGSLAVREAIERYQPLLGLHGHIHEARGATKIGRTVCVNPGSVYGQGLLAGVVVTTKRGKLRGYHLVEG